MKKCIICKRMMPTESRWKRFVKWYMQDTLFCEDQEACWAIWQAHWRERTIMYKQKNIEALELEAEAKAEADRAESEADRRPCPTGAILMIKGEYFPCDQMDDMALECKDHDGWAHSNTAAEAIWADARDFSKSYPWPWGQDEPK